MRPIASLFLVLAPMLLFGQDGLINERAAKEAVYRIVRHSGLQPDFVVRENPDIRTAIAFIKGRERVIEYDPDFIASVMDSTCTNWSAISILAHEIAHHLLGHTLDPAEVYPGDELACDRYSGFILQAMDAPLEGALAAMEVAGNPHGTRDHPPKHARLEAIRQGWEQGLAISERREAERFEVQDAFQYIVHFNGDRNTYYVDLAGRLVWFNTYAEPIEFGTMERLTEQDPKYRILWADKAYLVDGRNSIWNRTNTGLLMNVGRMEPYGRPK